MIGPILALGRRVASVLASERADNDLVYQMLCGATVAFQLGDARIMWCMSLVRIIEWT